MVFCDHLFFAAPWLLMSNRLQFSGGDMTARARDNSVCATRAGLFIGMPRGDRGSSGNRSLKGA